jgi:glycine dehydrogenase subunit 1
VVREFAVRLDTPVPAVLDRVAEDGIAAGYWLGRDYDEYEDGLLIAITERRSREDIDRLADSLARAIASGNGELVADSATKSPMPHGVSS